MKYLNFLFHNSNREDQPYYMMINPDNFKELDTNIKLKRTGNIVEAIVDDRRLVSYE